MSDAAELAHEAQSQEPPATSRRPTVSEETYRGLLQAIPDRIWRIERNGRISDCKAVGTTPTLVPERPSDARLSDVLTADVANSVQEAVRCALASGSVQTLEYTEATANGVCQFEARIAPAGSDSALAIVRDVTEERRAQTDSASHLARVEMLDAISQAFAGSTLDYSNALDMAVRRASELIGDLCVVARLTRDERSLIPIAAHDRNSAVRETIRRILSAGPLPARQGPLEPVVELGDSYLANEVCEKQLVELFGSATSADIERLGAHALLAVPMRVLGGITGALLLLRHRTGRRYRDADLVFAQAIADRAAVAIHASHLHAENLRQAEALRVMNRELERRIAERTAELERANELLRQQATEDSLTGLANRRHFDATLDLEIRRARRQKDNLTVLLVDVDYFKLYNDHYGHVQGDECLKRIADTLKATFRRAGDVVSRYGGEEFAVVLPGCDHAAATIVAERFRAAVEKLAIPHARSEVAPIVTVSVGTASFRVLGATNADALVRAADAALYRSKAEGRNRTTLSELS